MPSLLISPDAAGERLDRTLARLVPDMGLRGRRRLCAEGQVLVNGRPAKEALKLRPGDTVEILEATADTEDTDANITQAGSVYIVERTDHLAALYKPAGLHSAALAGKANPSLEALLPRLLPPGARLLNRLDTPTSGLVLAALDDEGRASWHGAQQRGLMEKHYVALLEGDLLQETLVRPLPSKTILTRQETATRSTRLIPLGRLDKRETSALLAHASATETPVPPADAGPDFYTLALCVIMRGSRHQIRAHAAHAGFPLAGDARYGGHALGSGEFFLLHHAAIHWPDFHAACAPPWLAGLPPELRDVLGPE